MRGENDREFIRMHFWLRDESWISEVDLNLNIQGGEVKEPKVSNVAGRVLSVVSSMGDYLYFNQFADEACEILKVFLFCVISGLITEREIECILIKSFERTWNDDWATKG